MEVRFTEACLGRLTAAVLTAALGWVPDAGATSGPSVGRTANGNAYRSQG
jgi:hypothetical protein